MNGIIYLSDYKTSEQEFLTSKNILTFRIADLQNIQDIDLSELRQGRFLLRGPKLKQPQFEEVFLAMKNKEVNLFTNITSFASISNFSNHYGIIKEFSPKSMNFERGTASNIIREHLEKEKVSSPVFLRSEIESAAKYVGVEGCIINLISDFEIEDKVCNLETHVTGFKNLIFKEVVSLKKVGEKNVEFRCVIVHDKLVFFDNDEEKSGLILTNDVIDYAQKVASHNYYCGIRGAYFLDLGVKTDDSITIIEMKDFINGTINNFEELASGLINLFQA